MSSRTFLRGFLLAGTICACRIWFHVLCSFRSFSTMISSIGERSVHIIWLTFQRVCLWSYVNLDGAGWLGWHPCSVVQSLFSLINSLLLGYDSVAIATASYVWRLHWYLDQGLFCPYSLNELYRFSSNIIVFDSLWVKFSMRCEI